MRRRLQLSRFGLRLTTRSIGCRSTTTRKKKREYSALWFLSPTLFSTNTRVKGLSAPYARVVLSPLLRCDAIEFVRVTETDKANEKLIFDAVRNSFPDDQLIGEESSADAGSIPALTDAPTWIVDPVDGESTSPPPSSSPPPPKAGELLV